MPVTVSGAANIPRIADTLGGFRVTYETNETCTQTGSFVKHSELGHRTYRSWRTSAPREASRHALPGTQHQNQEAMGRSSCG